MYLVMPLISKYPLQNNIETTPIKVILAHVYVVNSFTLQVDAVEIYSDVDLCSVELHF